MITKSCKTSTWPISAAALFAVVVLASFINQARPAEAAGAAPDPQAPPRIVSTSPSVGQTEVDPALTEIKVTFDRDMEAGFSWTGGGADFPASPEGQKAQWKDKRTCVMPVKLQEGHYYRVGINSPSFRNFRSVEGVSASPSAIYFTTKGASDALKRKVTKPQIVGLTPKNGATDVDANLKELRVTFNVEMAGSFSWCGGGPAFPTIPEGKKPSWTEDHKTCVLPVDLKPSSEYHLGLNAPSFKGFQSAGGVPLEPVGYSFKTK